VEAVASSSRGRQLKFLCLEALAQEPDARAAFLDQACAGDAALRHEVELLLAGQARLAGFLETPVWEPPSAVLTPGTRLGPYEIDSAIGAGGMGEVYKARDARLGRTVAIKVLPAGVASDPDRRRLFEQEARAASALNHPHICVVYDVGSQASVTPGAAPVHYLVMEHLDGQTLAAHLTKGKLPVSQALEIGIQLAGALSAAHTHGIVHRDLKPGNVMLVKGDGGATLQVKLLDFGLVKLMGRDESLASQPTIGAAEQTDEGRIVGTVSYMSPEQAQGRPVDERSDIFSFGSLLYEMVSGQKPFHGESSVTTLAAIIEKEPRPLSGEIPPDLEKVLARCLSKDPARRYQHIGDVKLELQDLVEENGSRANRAAALPPGRRRFPWILAAAASPLILAAAGSFLLVRGDRALPQTRVVNLTSYPGRETQPALSPDGTQVAFTWNGEKEDNDDIYVQNVGDTHATRVTTDPQPDAYPCWSPDGRRIAFVRLGASGTTGELRVISALGGPEQKLAEWPGVGDGVSWSPDGRWLAVSRVPAAGVSADDTAGIYFYPAQGGDWRRITFPKPPATDAYPRFSWNGGSLAFARSRPVGAALDVFIQALTPEGVPHDGPRQVTTTGMLLRGLAWHRDGRSLIVAADPAFGLTYLYRVFTDRHAPPERIELAGHQVESLSTSLGSTRLVFVYSDRNQDIWRLNPDGASAPLLRSSFMEATPEYSPDGRKVAFTSNRNEQSCEIWVANADGTNQYQLTHGPGRNQGTARWSPDGQWIAFDSQDEKGQLDIYVIEASGGQPRPLTSEASDEVTPSWSRDGQWIYFRSDRTGGDEIWRAPSAGGPAERITADGGQHPYESIDGRTLFYTKPAGELWTKPVDGGPERRLTGGVRGMYFAAAMDGLYYLGPRGTDGKWPLMFIDPSSRVSREVARFTRAPHTQGFTVSPDGRSVLYAVDAVGTGADLKLIEHFQ
jgi:eukaryotic-like serine/threonine-protein kinase